MKSSGSIWVRLPCLVVALYFAAELAYALWNFDAFGSRTPQFLRYVVGPAALFLIFAGLAVWLPRRAAARVNAYVAVVAIAIFAAQFVLSASSFLTTLSMVAEVKGSAAAGTDGSLPADLALDRLNIKAGVQSLDQALLGGVPNVPVFLCVDEEGPVRYEADRYGFNNPDHVHDSQVDIAMVGDSFIEGACLKPGSDFASLVRREHPGTVSLGMRGNGPLFELGVIGRFGPVIRPKTVILAFFEGNDLKDLAGELKMPWLRAGLEEGADFGSEPVPPRTLEAVRGAIDGYQDKRRTPLETLTSTYFVRNLLALQNVGAALGIAYPKVAAVPPAYGQALQRARDITASWGGRLALVYIPQVDRFPGLFPPSPGFDTLRLDIIAAAKAHDIDVIDLTPVFEAHEEPLTLYAPDSHLSKAGAAVAAQVVNDYLAKHPAAAPALSRTESPAAGATP